MTFSTNQNARNKKSSLILNSSAFIVS